MHSYTHTHWFTYRHVWIFLSLSAFVGPDFVRSTKVDQFFVIIIVVKISASTSKALNHTWPANWIMLSAFYLMQLLTDAKTWSDVYCASTTTHLVELMEPFQLQFPYVLRNVFMLKMNVSRCGMTLKLYYLKPILDSSTAAVQHRNWIIFIIAVWMLESLQAQLQVRHNYSMHVYRLQNLHEKFVYVQDTKYYICVT